jgi:hypothetical protein
VFLPRRPLCIFVSPNIPTVASNLFVLTNLQEGAVSVVDNGNDNEEDDDENEKEQMQYNATHVLCKKDVSCAYPNSGISLAAPVLRCVL